MNGLVLTTFVLSAHSAPHHARGRQRPDPSMMMLDGSERLRWPATPAENAGKRLVIRVGEVRSEERRVEELLILVSVPTLVVPWFCC